MNRLPGEMHTAHAVDFTLNPEDQLNFPVEFLNTQCPPGLPPAVLHMKVPTLKLHAVIVIAVYLPNSFFPISERNDCHSIEKFQCEKGTVQWHPHHPNEN